MFGSWLALSFQKLDVRWRARQHFCSERKGRISSSFDFSQSAKFANPQPIRGDGRLFRGLRPFGFVLPKQNSAINR